MHPFELEEPYITQEIVDTIRDPLLVLDDSLRVIYASRNFYKTFLVSKEDTVGSYLYDLGNGQWDIADLKKVLNDILPQEQCVEDYEITHEFSSIGKKVMLLNARRVISPNHLAPRILVAIEDITSKKKLEEKLVKMATTDQLTGLYNRYKFDEILDVVERACGEIDRSSASFLPNLKQGELALIGVDFPIPMTIHVSKPIRPPISDGPDYQSIWGND